jgi:lactate dehydrogenase-like 2-hydroxyacid dehydrogenase
MLRSFTKVNSQSHTYLDDTPLATAQSRGVVVCNIGSSDAERQDVAEQTFALMLALAKQLIPGHTALTCALPRLQRLITELHGKPWGSSGSATSVRKSRAAGPPST